MTATLGEAHEWAQARIMKPCAFCGKITLIDYTLHLGAFVRCFSCGYEENMPDAH